MLSLWSQALRIEGGFDSLNQQIQTYDLLLGRERMQITIRTGCHLWGEDFDPSPLNGLPEIIVHDCSPGTLGTTGRYKNKPIPRSAKLADEFRAFQMAISFV